jgi:hypothetical protein
VSSMRCVEHDLARLKLAAFRRFQQIPFCDHLRLLAKALLSATPAEFSSVGSQRMKSRIINNPRSVSWLNSRI